MIIAVDFDGTCVEHRFPEVGPDAPHSVEVLKEMCYDHDLILYTMRSRGYLQDATDWFKKHKIRLAGIQYSPGQTDWTSSNKCYANLYIDDAALGAPLLYYTDGRAPVINWLQVRGMLATIVLANTDIILSHDE